MQLLSELSYFKSESNLIMFITFYCRIIYYLKKSYVGSCFYLVATSHHRVVQYHRFLMTFKPLHFELCSFLAWQAIIFLRNLKGKKCILPLPLRMMLIMITMIMTMMRFFHLRFNDFGEIVIYWDLSFYNCRYCDMSLYSCQSGDLSIFVVVRICNCI